LLDGLKECHTSTPNGDPSLVTARTLSPSDVAVYAEIGHLMQFCGSNVDEQGALNSTVVNALSNGEDLDPASIYAWHRSVCRHSLATHSSMPSLPRILRYFKSDGEVQRQLAIYESHYMHVSLQSWTKHVVEMIVRSGGENALKWKLIVLAPGVYVSVWLIQ